MSTTKKPVIAPVRVAIIACDEVNAGKLPCTINIIHDNHASDSL